MIKNRISVHSSVAVSTGQICTEGLKFLWLSIRTALDGDPVWLACDNLLKYIHSIHNPLIFFLNSGSLHGQYHDHPKVTLILRDEVQSFGEIRYVYFIQAREQGGLGSMS